jgi:hypothetical protein
MFLYSLVYPFKKWVCFIALVFGREDSEDQPLNSELEARDCKGELKYFNDTTLIIVSNTIAICKPGGLDN